MIEVRPLTPADAFDLSRFIAGYTSLERYDVSRVSTSDGIAFELRLVRLERPFVKRFPTPDDATCERYAELIAAGHGFGAFTADGCAGLTLCEPQRWNASLEVRELHVLPALRRQHLGQRLLDAAVDYARQLGLRCVTCETQNTNAPAVAFYQRCGFRLDGVDLSLYAGDDAAAPEVALFMRRMVGTR